MLSAELIAKIKKIELRTGRMVTAALAGNYQSAFKGQGMEFDEVRAYVPGDDVRSIDWKVTARMQHPFIKVYREERELTLLLMVDVSGSQDFGSGGRTKKEIAAELAAIIAFLAIRNHDKVGLIIFSDQIEAYIPPKKGRGHVWHIIREVLGHQAKGQGTDFSTAFDYALRVQHRRAMCVLISDLRGKGLEDSLRRSRQRFDLICAELFDPLELNIAAAGVVSLVDAESGRRFFSNWNRSTLRKGFALQEGQRRQSLHQMLRKLGIDFMSLDVTKDVLTPLEALLSRRRKA